MAQTSDYGRRCELIGERLQWNGWKPCRSVIFFSPLSFFIGMLTERTIKEVKRKKLHSLNRRWRLHTRGNRAAKKTEGKKKQTKHENKLENVAASSKVVLEDCKFCFFCFLFFFFLPQLGDEKLLHVIAVTFYIYAQCFQSMANSWRSPPKGSVDSALLSISTSLTPAPPSCVALPPPPLASLVRPPLP